MTEKSYKELLAERAALEAQISAAKDIERQDAIAKIHELMELFEIDVHELSKQPRGKSRTSPPVKYRDPESGATWTGRGRAPRWMQGKDPAGFAV